LRCWSAGCGSGEEPYSLALLWAFRLAASFPGLSLAVVATDAEEHLLGRAARGCYPRATLRELPQAWIDAAFARVDGLHCLRREFREPVLFLRQDIRAMQPEGLFDLVLCRNLVFTYFDASLQRRALMDIAAQLRPGGALVVGRKEVIPDATFVEASPAGCGVYRRQHPPRSRRHAVGLPTAAAALDLGPASGHLQHASGWVTTQEG
jgi:chemotaxis protein methyltransferase CheR